ncbi:MAG: PEP-CTERM sorting domain-containing protein [Pirellulales bacterium]
MGGPPGDDNYWHFATQVDSFDEIYSDDPNYLNSPDPTSTGNFRKRDHILDNGYDDDYAVEGVDGYPYDENYLTDVGAYSLSQSYYGTFDQTGNVQEMTDSLYYSTFGQVVRGGAWESIGGISSNQRSFNGGGFGGGTNPYTGFRMATLVPEPGSVILFVLGVAAVVARFRFWQNAAFKGFARNAPQHSAPAIWP